MISESCDMNEFIKAIQDKDYYEAIYLADREATAAERLKRLCQSAEGMEGCSRYVQRLKGFIHFMRYGVKSRLLDDQDLETLQAIREELLERQEMPDASESEISPPN